MKVERRPEFEVDEIECLLLEIFPKKSKSYLIGILYRHPNESVNWNENFEILMDKLLETKKEFYLLGDFNRDLLNEQHTCDGFERGIREIFLPFQGDF